MAVEARFVCVRKEVVDQVSVDVTLSASVGGQDNVNWAPYTPSGSIVMRVTGPAAAEFVCGGRYRVRIEQVAENG